MMNDPTPEEEAKVFLSLTDGALKPALEMAQRQLDVVYMRAQVLMSLAGVVVTTTGFSGRLIAGTSTLAQIFLIAGLAVTLCSAVWVFLRVMRVRWVTVLLCENPENPIASAIYRRNRKTKAYSIGGLILFVGLALYCVSIGIMLLNPEPLQVPVR